MKALLLAAGLGTRLKPFTDNHPKALAPVNGHSLLEINIRNLQRFGIYDVVVNVHHFASQIVEKLQHENGFGSRFQISDESDEVLETGGGLKKAAPFFKDEKDFLVMNVDMLTNANLREMIQQHQKNDTLVTLAVQQRSSSRYFLFDDEMQLKGWENVNTGERKPAIAEDSVKQYAFSGIQILDQDIFSKINRQGKFSLVDIYLDLCVTEKIAGLDHSGDLLLDVGKPESLIKASELFKDIF
ncbi:nucleotidyltransferase family protein [Taibaiella lutea]|uniref:Nucleotidyltransferase family protein n=1 Tax=Taibaiella lutea TaxID=2608001 RepID=A0A5M6CPG8_9BACT|nr:nucleotidyltransferase family protein [Taibaiella lutea]KAA5537158.1 nucleotidyltransferase family protein [Taibaiella lutea]